MPATMNRAMDFACVLLVAWTLLVSGGPAAALTDPGAGLRQADPIVLSGARLARLDGASIDELAAFRRDATGWQPILVQVDERVLTDFFLVYDFPGSGLPTLSYADPTTYTGPDDNPFFDVNDELVFMARDAGRERAFGVDSPIGAIAETGVEIIVVDPLTAQIGFVYLFEMDSSLSQIDLIVDADYVDYYFRLLGGEYLDTYNTRQGPNLEDSEIVTDFYRTHFSERWIRDELNVFCGTSTGVDILDRHTNLFGPGICERSEDTFSAGEGAFFANLDGPVRAIRSYLGANSGPLTQRDHFFYDRRQDIVTTLRVHEIPGVMDLYDYSPEAVGMMYYNSQNSLGVLVDGVDDLVAAGPISWEMVTGEQGTLVSVHQLETDIDSLTHTSFYLDDEFPLTSPCTGDTSHFGLSGVWINATVPSTDPLIGDPRTLRIRRTVIYDEPFQSASTAGDYAEQVAAPLFARVRPFPAVAGDFDANCFVDGFDYVELERCVTSPDSCSVTGCELMDLDNDCGVTLKDFAELQISFTGPAESVINCEP